MPEPKFDELEHPELVNEIELDSLNSNQPSRAPIPKLRLDTSNLVHRDDSERIGKVTADHKTIQPKFIKTYEISDEQPSSILGLAKGEDLQINDWLSDRPRDGREKKSSLSPAKFIFPETGARRDPASLSSLNSHNTEHLHNSTTSALRSPKTPSKIQLTPGDSSASSLRHRSPSPLSRNLEQRAHSPYSPGVYSDFDEEEHTDSYFPPFVGAINHNVIPTDSTSPLHSPLSGVPKNPNNPISPLKMTVERTFQNNEAAETPMRLRPPRTNTTGGLFETPFRTQGSTTPVGDRKTSEPESTAYQNNSSVSLSASNNSANLDLPENWSSSRRLSNSIQHKNLTLSGAAYVAQHDLLEPEEGNDGFSDDMSSNRSQTDDEGVEANERMRKLSEDVTVLKKPLGRTLFYFDSENCVRRLLHRIVSSQIVFYLEVLLTLAQIVVLSVDLRSPYVSTDDGVSLVINEKATYAYIGFYIFFTLLFLAQAISYGVFTNEPLSAQESFTQLKWLTRYLTSFLTLRSVKPPRPLVSKYPFSLHGCVLRHSWGRVEFLSLVFFWTFTGIIMTADSDLSSLDLIISGLGHLRILRMLDYLIYTRIILHVLKVAIPLLQNVLLFIGFFLVIWSIIGVQSFNGSLRRVCFYNDTITSRTCGSWLHPDTLEVMPYLLLDSAHAQFEQQPKIKGYSCPVGSVCIEIKAFPAYGSFAQMANRSFDNIFNSLEIVFILMSNNGFTNIMYDIIDSENLASCLFFISGVLILGIWLMNLLVAVMVSSYVSVRDEFNYRLNDPMFLSIQSWFGKFDFRQKRSQISDLEDNVDVDEKRYHSRWILEETKWGQMYTFMYPLFALLALIDLLFQAAKPPNSVTLYWWEVAMAAAFGFDIVLRIFVYLPYWRYFFFSFTNIIDLVLAIGNCIILAFYHHEILYSWLTIIQLLRVYRMVVAISYARLFWIQVFGNMKALLSLATFFFAMTFLCALITGKMLRGQFAMKGSDGSINVSSFYDLASTFISLYEVASTENWTDILFWATENVSRAGGNVIGLACMGILFCSWLFFANFIIFNLFVGIMSESLHGAIANKRAEQVRQFAEELKEKNFNQEGTNFGNLLPSFGALSSSDDLDEGLTRHVSFKEKLMATLMHWVSWKTEQTVISRPMRAAIERKLVIEFLELHGDLEKFSTVQKTAKETFMSLKTDQRAHGFSQYKNSAVYLNLKSAVLKVYAYFHHFPQDYRNYMHKKLEKDIPNDSNHKTAYVENLFDYNKRILTILEEYCELNPKFDKSLLIFTNKSRVRRFFQRLFPPSSGARLSRIYPRGDIEFYVRSFFLVATVSIVVQACVRTPLKGLDESTSETWTASRTIDLVYGIIFSTEFFGKVIADGFHFAPNAYTRSAWNWIDLIVLISIWMTFISDLLKGVLSRYLRAFLALRALRIISIFRKSEMLLSSVFFYGLRNLLGAFLIALSIVVPYAVWGKQIFHDRLSHCNDGNVDWLTECIDEYSATVFSNFEVLAPRAIQNHYFSYDQFWDSLLIQFGVLSLEGWVDVLQAVASITGDGKQPQTYASTGNAVFPIFYNFIGAIIIITMLISVIIRNYSLTIGTAFLTEEQLSWLDVKRTLKLVKPTPKPPHYKGGSLRYRLLGLVPTWINSIEIWTLFVVTVDLAAYFYPLDFVARKVYKLILLACSVLLVSLSLLRLIIFKPTLFSHSWWNPFGLVVCIFVVILTIIDMTLPDKLSDSAQNLSRAAFICLLLMWIPRTKRLYQFYSIGTAALSEISTLLFAWFILYLTYAIALNQSFGLIKLGEQSTWNRNFRTIPKALIALFTMSCGEGWNQFLMDFTLSKPYCIHTNAIDECGISGFAYFLFITWNLISMYVFANLFISLVCEACWYVYRSGTVKINESDLVSILDSWQQFDRKGTGYIRANDIFRFLGRSQGYFSIGIFSRDPEYSVSKILEATQTDARTVMNPYDVNMDAIYAYLADMPVQKYQNKRLLYEMFAAQAQLLAAPIPGGRGIRFSKLVLLFPLYKDMNPAETLTLKEFIMLKVQLHEARLLLAANFIARKWRAKMSNMDNDHANRRTPGLGYDEHWGPSKDNSTVYWVS